MSFTLISFFVWNSGISTLITFLNCCFISKVFPVAINAVFNTCSLMPALATANSILAAFNPFSTFNLKSMFSFIKSINWRTSSSRLSFKSLWPLVADKSFFFCFVSSIRVGFTLVPAILYLALKSTTSFNIPFQAIFNLTKARSRCFHLVAVLSSRLRCLDEPTGSKHFLLNLNIAWKYIVERNYLIWF